GSGHRAAPRGSLLSASPAGRLAHPPGRSLLALGLDLAGFCETLVQLPEGVACGGVILADGLLEVLHSLDNDVAGAGPALDRRLAGLEVLVPDDVGDHLVNREAVGGKVVSLRHQAVERSVVTGPGHRHAAAGVGVLRGWDGREGERLEVLIQGQERGLLAGAVAATLDGEARPCRPEEAVVGAGQERRCSIASSTDLLRSTAGKQ